MPFPPDLEPSSPNPQPQADPNLSGASDRSTPAGNMDAPTPPLTGAPSGAAPRPAPPKRYDGVNPVLVEGAARALIARDRLRPFRRAVWIGGIILILALLMGIIPRLRRSRELAQSTREEATRLPVLTVARAQPAPPVTKLTLPGNIQAVQETPIYARSSGYLRRFFVDIGQHVRVGQVLAEVETPDIDQQAQQAAAEVTRAQAAVVGARAQSAQAQSGLQQMRAQAAQARSNLARSMQTANQQSAQLAQARANASLARITWQRWRSLVAGGAISRQEADQQEAAYKVSLANVAAVQSSLNGSREDIHAYQAALRAAGAEVQAAGANVRSSISNVGAAQAGVGAARSNLNRLQVLGGFREIRAPFNGIITQRNIDTGALVSGSGGTSGGATGASSSSASSGGAATGLFTLARTDQLTINIDVPQTYVQSVRVGQRVRVDVRESPLQQIVGSIARTSNALDPNTRTLRVQIQLANATGALRPGMYSEVEVNASSSKPPLMVPSSALLTDAQGMRVITVSKDNTAHFHDVEVGHDYGQQLEIISGLQPHALVAVNPAGDLKEGAKVKAVLQKKPAEQQGHNKGKAGAKAREPQAGNEEPVQNKTSELGQGGDAGGQNGRKP